MSIMENTILKMLQILFSAFALMNLSALHISGKQLQLRQEEPKVAGAKTDEVVPRKSCGR